MIAGMRAAFAAAVLASALTHAGCDEKRTLTCSAAVDEFCAAAGGCIQTWDEAWDATSFCSEGTQWPPMQATCGGYYIVAISLVDASRTYYYAAASGLLTAIVTADAVQGTTACNAGPAAGFTLPVCSGAMSQDLAQCRDGGAGTDAAVDAGGG
jgi:hypothetical protein